MQYKFEPHKISIAMGTVDEESIVGSLPMISEHIFLQDKAKWWKLADEDGTQRYKTFPKEFQKSLDQWKAQNPSRA